MIEIDLTLSTPENRYNNVTTLAINRSVRADEKGFEQFMEHCATAWGRITATAKDPDE